MADPLSQVERATSLFERGPSAVAAFFALAFFVAAWFLLRAKDRHLADVAQRGLKHAEELAELNASRLAEFRKGQRIADTFLELIETKRQRTRRVITEKVELPSKPEEAK